jgi:hypothetical protein
LLNLEEDFAKELSAAVSSLQTASFDEMQKSKKIQQMLDLETKIAKIRDLTRTGLQGAKEVCKQWLPPPTTKHYETLTVVPKSGSHRPWLWK